MSKTVFIVIDEITGAFLSRISCSDPSSIEQEDGTLIVGGDFDTVRLRMDPQTGALEPAPEPEPGPAPPVHRENATRRLARMVRKLASGRELSPGELKVLDKLIGD